MEKLLGLVFLAVYLGIPQLVLFFAGVDAFDLNETPTQQDVVAQLGALCISALAVVPFLLFAVCPARRYKLARTRWRGIWFGRTFDDGVGGFHRRRSDCDPC